MENWDRPNRSFANKIVLKLGTIRLCSHDGRTEERSAVIQLRGELTAGDNTVTVVATDVNGNTATNRYNVPVTGRGSKNLVYDANGNLTSDGTRTFEGDPLNRLTAVTSGMHRSEFTYNGLGQRVSIVEKDNGAAITFLRTRSNEP